MEARTTETLHRCDERKAKQGGRPLLDIYINQRNDIPLNKDWSKRRCTMNWWYQDNIKSLLDFECRSDDVWVITMPKCGTTWMQEAAWLICNDFDFKTAKSVSIFIRSPFVEMSSVREPGTGPKSTIEQANNTISPRVLKSHLPSNLLPTDLWKKKNKVIYVARNVKDAVVSFSNIFFTSYERMKQDLRGVIKDLCVFLDRTIPNDEILDAAIKHLSFDNMKNSESGKELQKLIEQVKQRQSIESNFQFFKRGIVGSYKDELSEELVAKLDKWSAKFLTETNVTNEQLFS